MKHIWIFVYSPGPPRKYMMHRLDVDRMVEQCSPTEFDILRQAVAERETRELAKGIDPEVE